MTILFKEDWELYPNAVIDTNTKNTSFLRIAAMFRDMGIVNHAFPLQLHNPELSGIDPYSNDLTQEQQIEIAIECKNNFFYFIRECVRVPGGGYDNPIKFRANRGNIALYWLFMNHIANMLIQPRQTGKSFSTDVLMRYLVNLRCTNTKINLLTKDDTLRSANLNRLKDLESELPVFLIQRARGDLANTEKLTIKSLGNSYEGHVPNKSPKMAMNVGRGLTSPIFHVDEAGFFYNVGITVPAALAAGTAARDLAKLKNEPYGNIFTTTAAKKDDKDGAYIYKLLCNSAIWTEKFLDAGNQEGLYKLIRSNSSTGELRVNCTFSHRQLGYNDAWLKEALENSLATGEDADRDFFNIWTSGTHSSPLSVEQSKMIRDSQRNDFFAEIASPYSYVTRWFIPEEAIQRTLKNGSFVLSLDTSDAVGNDDIGMHLRCIKTGAIIASGNYNETNLITFTKWILDWLLTYDTITLIIERRSTGAMVIDYLILMLLENNINPFTRIYNKVIQEAEEFPLRFKEVMQSSYGLANLTTKYKKTFGFATSSSGATSRNELYGNTLSNAVKLTGDKVHDSMTIDQLLGLTTKNGRVDHADGAHDDMCIAWLLSFWLIQLGKNLHVYNIKASEILADNKKAKTVNDPKVMYENKIRHDLRNQAEQLVEDIYKQKDPFLTKRLEAKLKHIVSKMPNEDQDIVSVENLITRIKEAKRTKKLY